jgi:hypothetical protein
LEELDELERDVKRDGNEILGNDEPSEETKKSVVNRRLIVSQVPSLDARLALKE